MLLNMASQSVTCPLGTHTMVPQPIISQRRVIPLGHARIRRYFNRQKKRPEGR
jgi:hypothetical protein